MTIDEKLKWVEELHGEPIPIMFTHQRQMLLKWLNMTDKERDETIIKSVRNFYACRRPVLYGDYWPVSLTKYCCCETKAGKHEELNKEAFDINQRRRAKGLKWSVEIK